MEYEVPRWKALFPALLPVPPLVLFAVSGELWAGAGFFLSIALAIVLGTLWCACPGCGANMAVRGGLNPFGRTPYVCRRCGAQIQLK